MALYAGKMAEVHKCRHKGKGDWLHYFHTDLSKCYILVDNLSVAECVCSVAQLCLTLRDSTAVARQALLRFVHGIFQA